MADIQIDPRFIVNLKGKDFPTYPGVLDAATKAVLVKLTTQIVQIPSPENGHMAVVLARAEFADGRVFEDVGDASPASCSPQIATAALRMASTRGKGRVLRDSINCGMTLLEELPDEETTPRSNGHHAAPQPQRAAPRARHDPQDHAERQATAEPKICEECGASVPAEVAEASVKRFRRVLCIPDGKAEQARLKEVAATASA